MGEFQDMLSTAIAKWQATGQNIRSLAKKLDCPHSTLILAAAGKINPPMKYLVQWSSLFETAEDRDRFVRLGAAMKLGVAMDAARAAASRAMSPVAVYSTSDLEAQLAEAHRRIAELERELAELRGRSADNTAMRELTAMLDPDETNTPADHPRAPAIAGRPRRGH